MYERIGRLCGAGIYTLVLLARSMMDLTGVCARAVMTIVRGGEVDIGQEWPQATFAAGVVAVVILWVGLLLAEFVGRRIGRAFDHAFAEGKQ